MSLKLFIVAMEEVAKTDQPQELNADDIALTVEKKN